MSDLGSDSLEIACSEWGSADGPGKHCCLWACGEGHAVHCCLWESTLCLGGGRFKWIGCTCSLVLQYFSPCASMK